MSVKRTEALRERAWETAQGEHIKLRDMDTNHVHNCLGLIRKRTRRELEITQKSGKKFRIGIAKAENVVHTLEKIDGAIGSDLALEIKTQLETKYNNSLVVGDEEINKHLLNDVGYQALLFEIECREREAREKIKEAQETPQDSFLESKGKVLVTDILERPQDIPMVIVCECDSTISRTIKVGDYFAIQNDYFRITFLHRKSVAKSNNDILDLTLNAKRESEKKMVIETVKLNEHLEVY
ncbi:MAG: hypothetical protein P8J32_07510 [bacterium]|nr:hypothetical protein [bacterium]